MPTLLENMIFRSISRRFCLRLIYLFRFLYVCYLYTDALEYWLWRLYLDLMYYAIIHRPNMPPNNIYT